MVHTQKQNNETMVLNYPLSKNAFCSHAAETLLNYYFFVARIFKGMTQLTQILRDCEYTVYVIYKKPSLKISCWIIVSFRS